jgi:3-oxoacyl-[acyl-carrier protein] reductase
MGADRSLDGRVAIVTGAAGDLGSALAIALGQAGAAVVVHHLREPERAEAVCETIRAAGAEALALDADVTVPAEVQAMVAEAERVLGPLDILVNNAGVMDEGPLLETTLEAWKRTIDVNLTGVFICTQAVIGGMAERGSGAVVNVASQLAFKGARDTASYCASKGGVVGFTHALAREFGPAVRVNAVAPGPLETSMTGPFATPEWRAYRTAHMVSGELGDPADVAPAVVFLASDAAALFHGQTLHCNGGGVMGA